MLYPLSYGGAECLQAPISVTRGVVARWAWCCAAPQGTATARSAAPSGLEAGLVVGWVWAKPRPVRSPG